MQAQWTRTPFRLAVPIPGLLSSPRVAANPSTPATPPFLLTHNPRPRSRIPPSTPAPSLPTRLSSSSASSQWKLRQGKDYFARSARVQGLKSRAAFKLLELDDKYHLFSRNQGQVVVDLGFAPGSWSQVALDRTAPNGRVVGIDIIPAHPPRGVSTIQGNFLSPGVQGMVKQFLLEGEKRRLAAKAAAREAEETKLMEEKNGKGEEDEGDEVADRPSYIEMERMAARESDAESTVSSPSPSPSPDEAGRNREKEEKPNLRLVDVVLSDMMMNTSGIAFRDHAGSMDLCHAALSFASDTLKPGGHFVCKFYQGAEDKAFEKLLQKMFARVHREKPESSRSESREAFFVALKRKGEVTLADVEGR
ncbi:FtsJ-like methyltransferase-domain-containing protein [Chaetomium strumarium]|uniref:rRNA methyltransferase 2, mitochondrial n=1 Tax=Chaetomium strumarium TaxID=1170767 RepID=A0AAJ0GSG8_9PEZI|nr:FtsJ-like methyltransferase-domain-containing protein [Chaetomium strumarium]